MKKLSERLIKLIMFALCFNVLEIAAICNDGSEEVINVNEKGVWEYDGEMRNLSIITVTKNSQYLTIQDSNPVNTITVKITSNETGATVFENVYPQGQTSFIVIPMDGWSAGSYTIELFGRENNGYLWGTFQVLP